MNTHTVTSSFTAHDLFDIEAWVMGYCSEHGGPALWKWWWHGADDMSAMSYRLCDEGIDIDGEVSVIVEESVRGKSVGFRIEVGNVVIVIGRQSTRQEAAPVLFAETDDATSLPVEEIFTAEEYLREFEGP